MAFLPTDNTQDVSGLPMDENLAKLELQRKLKLADMLQQSQVPQGQMVSGHYVAPSWTQYAANAYNIYKGKQAEKEAINKYDEYYKSKEEKMADALKKLGGAFEPKTVTNTTMQTQDVPLSEGMNVATSPFGTAEQVGQTSPFATQNMTGTTTQMNPVTSTSTVQPTTADIEKAFSQYATDTKNPQLLASILTNKYEKMLKANEPVKLGAGESVFSATGQKLFGNPKEGEKYKHVTQDKAGNSYGLNTETNQWEQLPGAKMTTEGWSAPYKVGGEWLQRNSVTGKIEKVYGTTEGQNAPSGFAFVKDAQGNKKLDANGNPILVSLTGGPADKSLNPTENQSNAAAFADRMTAADKTISSLEGKYSPFKISIATSNKTSMIPGGTAVANAMLGDKEQRVEQAQREFINAILRRESGAAISPSEFESYSREYFPEPNDTPGKIQQKREARARAISGLNKAAGPIANKPTQSNIVNFEDLK